MCACGGVEKCLWQRKRLQLKCVPTEAKVTLAAFRAVAVVVVAVFYCVFRYAWSVAKK